MSLLANEGSPVLGLPSSPQWVEKSTVVSHGPLIMGVVNVTPDSFFDGGAHHTHDLALEHALALLGEGADILDVGGESTRPGAEPVSEAEELDRVLPVIEAIRSRSDIFISVDTSRSRVMREALALGANLINDVWAFRREPDAFDVAVSKERRFVSCTCRVSQAPCNARLNMKTLSQKFWSSWSSMRRDLSMLGTSLNRSGSIPGSDLARNWRTIWHCLRVCRGLSNWVFLSGRSIA